jgi:acetoacetyl-CoA synthetase
MLLLSVWPLFQLELSFLPPHAVAFLPKILLTVDMGASGINDRLSQIRPKLIFADNGALYNGKVISQIDKLRAIVTTLDSPTLIQLIIIPRISSEPKLLSGFDKSISYEDFLAKASNAPLVFEQVEFNHPAVIVYSSGTTGKPKCIVHHHGVGFRFS